MNKFRYEHQWPVAGYNELLVADFAAGATQEVVTLPAGAQVIAAWVLVTTVYNAATTATVSVGDATLATRYGSGIDVKTLGRKSLTPTGFIQSAKGPVTVTLAQAGTAATTGAVRVYVEYIVERKADVVSE